jgi:hypothetical protein
MGMGSLVNRCSERGPEERLLPLARDRGIAVMGPAAASRYHSCVIAANKFTLLRR